MVMAKSHSKWLNVAETASFIGAGVGVIAATALQQVAYYAVPTTILLLLNYRWRGQLEQRDNTAAVIQMCRYVADKLGTVAVQVEQLKDKTAEQEKLLPTLLPQESLKPIFSQIHKLQRQQNVTEQIILPTQGAFKEVQQELQTVQQHLTAIDASIGYLHNQNQKKKVIQIPARNRMAIFVDSADLERTAREQNIRIDYEKLLKVLTKEALLVGAWYYTAADPTDVKHKIFLSSLVKIGYHVVSKTIIKWGNSSITSDLDLELKLDMFKFINHYDTAILISGDSDFVPVVDEIKERGVKVEVVSWRSNTSKRLMETASNYTDIESIINKISWKLAV